MSKTAISIVLSAFLAFSFGCEDDEIDHRPAAGLGAIGIDNDTFSDIDVYIDGVKQTTVGDWDEKAWDIAPGKYRLVLNDQDSDRRYSADIDVIEDNLTEVTVTPGFTDHNDFDVSIVFRD